MLNLGFIIYGSSTHPLAFRKAQRGRGNKASEKLPNPPPQLKIGAMIVIYYSLLYFGNDFC